MVFSSITFLYFFLPAVLLIYYISPKKIKNIVLLLSGLFFYAWGEPVYVVIMIFSSFIDYAAGLIIDKYDDNQKKRTAALLVSLIINLGLLGVFKYSGFFARYIWNRNKAATFTYRNIVLHFPEYVLYYRYVHEKNKGSEKLFKFCYLCFIISCR